MAKNSSNTSQVHEILDQLSEDGLLQHSRPSWSLFLSALAAGLEIGFSILLMGVLFSLFQHRITEPAMHLLLALSYPLGFLFVIVGREELFTEQTTIAVIPVLSKKRGFSSLLRLWGIVLGGNIIGCFIFSIILATLPVEMEIIKPEAYQYIARQIPHYKWNSLFGSAIFAGWLMGLLAWLISSTTETISRLLLIILVTFVIGVAGLHQCIVGSVEMFAAMLTGNEITLSNYIYFLSLAVPGNIIGGAVFVAALKVSHNKKEDLKEKK
ncbi:MAG: formate/nitrite transporter family protein [Ginsengibacter sp.]